MRRLIVGGGLFAAAVLLVLGGRLLYESVAEGLVTLFGALGLILGAGLALAWPRRSLQRSATTDELTGLLNRRSLNEDLAHVEGRRGSVRISLFDLNGFKGYNDAYGHQAGDALLARLGTALGACVAPGRAYRLGGDEFCVIAPLVYADAVESRAEYALTEHGTGFTITASWGSVAFPRDASTPSEALALADERMYREKDGRRSSAHAQTKAALTQLTLERDPELAEHHRRVAALVGQVATGLGLHPDQVGAIRDAAELHDVGLLAIPSSIRVKVSPLDPAERAFLHRHAVIGARVLSAAESLQHAAVIVRASHERWDGSGYPGQLAREDIPIGARILAVCDAYDSMIHSHPYRDADDPEAARREVRTHAGTQFDPEVVTVFESVLEAECVRRRAEHPRAA